MNRMLLFTGMNIISSTAYAWGDSAALSIKSGISLIVLGLISVTALLLPLSCILFRKSSAIKSILPISVLGTTGLIVSTLLFVINSNPYMLTIAMVLLASSLLAPILYLFIRSTGIFKGQNTEN